MTLSEVLSMAKYDGWERGFRDGQRYERRAMSTNAPRVTPGFKDGLELSQEGYEEMQRAFRLALRQWKMYAEIEPDRDLAKEQSPEAEMYRAALALSTA
jgi:hypothetical protein